jgi:hypothetical protein
MLGHGQKGGVMGELSEWLKYWRKTFAKCFKIHKDSRPHKQAFSELSDYLDKVEASADREELDATVLWAVKFMQRMHELEREIGLHVPGKHPPSVKASGHEPRDNE